MGCFLFCGLLGWLFVCYCHHIGAPKLWREKREKERQRETVHKEAWMLYDLHTNVVAVITPSHIHRKANVKASSIRNECLWPKCCTTAKDNHSISDETACVCICAYSWGEIQAALIKSEADERLLREMARSLCVRMKKSDNSVLRSTEMRRPHSIRVFTIILPLWVCVCMRVLEWIRFACVQWL